MATHKGAETVQTPVLHDLSRDDGVVIPFPTGRTKRRSMTVRPDFEEDIVAGF